MMKKVCSKYYIKIRPQYNETTKLLQYYYLARHHDKSLGGQLSRFRTAAMECNYKEVDWKLK